MPHADSAQLPSSPLTKAQFWEHVCIQLQSLLEGQTNWVSNLANTSSLVYHALRSYEGFGIGSKAVNWCGFYIEESYFPPVSRNEKSSSVNGTTKFPKKLLLAPFSGKPACQYINIPKSPRNPDKNLSGAGVCADAFSFQTTLVVPDVDKYEGHIACDGETKSEIVIPVYTSVASGRECVGVLDLDCLTENGFDDDDKKGLEKIAALVGEGCDWVKLRTEASTMALRAEGIDGGQDRQ